MESTKFSIMNKKDHFGEGLLKLDAGSIPSLFGNITDGVLMVDDEGVIIFVNDRFCRLFGYTEGDLTGISFNDAANILFDEASITWINAKLQQVYKGKNQFFRHNWKMREGSFLPVEIDISPTYNSDNDVIGALFIIKDIHSRLLLEITNTVNSTLELDEVLKNTNRITIERLGLDCNAIFLLGANNRELQMTSCNIRNQEIKDKMVIPITQGNLGKITQTGTPAYLGKIDEEMANTGYSNAYFENMTLVGFPLVCKGENLGVITFGSGKIRKFSEIEMGLFHSISNQVAMALYNAKLFQRLELMSVTDGLTGLYNHKYFKKRLKEELKRAKGEYSLSLLMIDVDDFKRYNDTFGHPAGDQLLEKIAKILRNNMRNKDVVARYGGEEFAIILVQSEPLQALNTAERIRQAVERYRFSGREQLPGGKVTISIGLGCYPVHVNNSRDLLNVTDTALYEAKKNKNTVVMAH